MKKLLYLFALIIPLSAQEVKEEVENKEPEQCCVEKETTTQKVVRHLQDAEWRKFQAAHRRAHSKRGEHTDREFKKTVCNNRQDNPEIQRAIQRCQSRPVLQTEKLIPAQTGDDTSSSR